MRRLPRRQGSPRLLWKRSAAARHRASSNRTRRSSIGSAPELFDTRRLSDEAFNKAVAALGERGLVEVIAIIGYYTHIGNTLNVFAVAVPEGAAPPFPE